MRAPSPAVLRAAEGVEAAGRVADAGLLDLLLAAAHLGVGLAARRDVKLLAAVEAGQLQELSGRDEGVGVGARWAGSAEALS